MRTKLFSLLFAVAFSGFAQLYQIPVYTATSLQTPQPGEEVSKAIDNDNNTIYHSDWNQNGIPDELNFYFSNQVQSIKKMIYTPRQSGQNGIWTDVSIYYSTQSSPDNFILIQDHLIWQPNNQNKEIILNQAIQQAYTIKFVIHQAYNNFSSCAEMRFYSETEIPIDNGIDCEIPTTELELNGQNDVKATILVNGSTASSYQAGEDITKSFDNNLNTLYHSSWSNTVFPVVLNYRLNGNTPIDYLKYIPRSDGGTNGNFGNVTIRYNTASNSNFQYLMNYNFDQTGIPTSIYFPNQITPLNIEITVQDGSGGFASCAEMEFYTQGNPGSPNPIPAIFADDLCSALIPGTTQSQINSISSPFYKSLAQCLFDQTYNKAFRVQSYEVYPTVSAVSNELKIGTYDIFENPTGILFDGNQKIALFARNIPTTASVLLAVKDFETSFDGPVSYYELQNGLNVFQTTNGGLGYISYFNNNLSLDNVEINIVSGKINGYFDNQLSTNSDWPELLSKTTYPMIDLRGEFVHLVYEREALKYGSPFDGLSLISKYDTIVRHERMLMGLFKYDRSPKNRQLTYSDHGGGWWAGGLGVHLDLDWGVDSMTNPEQLDVWGIPHEYGHINQIRPDLLWIGTTEVTNNIYSVWVNYQMNNEHVPYSRMEAEKVSPAPGMQPVEGGRINGALYNTLVNQQPLQGNDDYDVFEVLSPFWQLELYYSLSGAARNAPVLSFDYPEDYTGVDYAHWFGIVAEIVRTNNNPNLTNGEYLLNFVKNTCDAVQEDLTGFFIKTGFLMPIDRYIDDYGVGLLKITQEQIDTTIAYIQSKNYQQPVSPVIQYISAHSIEAYKNQLPLSGQTGQGVSLSGSYLTVQHSVWKNAVAYETYNPQNELVFVSISGTGDLSNQTTKVYYPSNGSKVYAVGFDGQKILVYPENLSISDVNADAEFGVYPNPVYSGQLIHLVLKNATGEYKAGLYNLDGKIIGSFNGEISVIEQKLNSMLSHQKAGIFVLKISKGEKSYQLKLIKK